MRSLLRPPGTSRSTSRSISLLRVLANNPLEAWTSVDFEQPIVTRGMSIGRVAVGKRSSGNPPRTFRQLRKLPEGLAATPCLVGWFDRRAVDRRRPELADAATGSGAVVCAQVRHELLGSNACGCQRAGRASR